MGIKERMVRPYGNTCPSADFSMQIEEGYASSRPMLQRVFLNPSGNATAEGVPCVREDPRCYHRVSQARVL